MRMRRMRRRQSSGFLLDTPWFSVGSRRPRGDPGARHRPSYGLLNGMILKILPVCVCASDSQRVRRCSLRGIRRMVAI